MATALTESADEDAQARYRPDIALGDLIATLAISGQDGAPEGADLTAARGGDGWVLSGDAAFVLDGHAAGLVLAPTRLVGTSGAGSRVLSRVLWQLVPLRGR